MLSKAKGVKRSAKTGQTKPMSADELNKVKQQFVSEIEDGRLEAAEIE